jgi:lipopolysaccharide/colanic/teichoic acid biosynthesis glycosyltransferase
MPAQIDVRPPTVARALGRQSGAPLLAKVVVDKLASTLGLLVLGPVLLVAAVAVRLTLGAPVFFVQVRPGRGAKPLRLIKFRTMTDARGPNGLPLPDAVRLTSLGRLLRATSVDELPQLWNVFRGDLSLVGPRPLLMEYLPRYTPEQARRHEVLPGITGWAQVNGRNALSWEEKFALDVWYVDNWSVGLDARIMFRTFWAVLRRSGVSSGEHATMPEFMGTDAADREEA